jgi:hypothetical protein
MWAKIDDGFFDHPKARAAGKDGRALFLASLCWAGRSQLEGVIDRSVLQLLAAKAEVKAVPTARRLVEVRLWEVHPDGWLIHDYLDYNPSADKVKEIRDKRAEAGRRGGQKSKRPGSKPEANCLANDDANPEAESEQNLTPSSSSSSSSSPSGFHPQTTESGSEPPAERGEGRKGQVNGSRPARAPSRSDAWADERNRSQAGDSMVSDWGKVRALASQGNHRWREHPDLSPLARAAASEVAVTIKFETADSARVAFYEAWKRLKLEGVR